MKKPVKIIAESEEDLKILSACLQDALIPLKEASFDTQNKKFFLLANRYQWEKSTPKDGSRTHAGVSFENVEKVETSGLNLKEDSQKKFSLLNISQEGEHVLLTFSEGGKIRLKTNQLKIKLRDDGVPWPAKTPKHK